MQSLPDMNELMKLAASPAGKQLMDIVKKSRLNLDQLSRDAAAGNMEHIKKQLSVLLENEDTKKLIQQLEFDL